jgi:hypothetical protein
MIVAHRMAQAMKSLLMLSIFIKSSRFLDSAAAREVAKPEPTAVVVQKRERWES